MNNTNDPKYKVEKASEDSRWTMTFKETVDEAQAYIGSSEHWRITNFLTNKVIAQSEGELPEIFDRDHNATTLVGTSNTRTETQTGYISRFTSPRGI